MEKFLTAILLTFAILSYRTVLTGSEPGGGREAEQMQNMAVTPTLRAIATGQL